MITYTIELVASEMTAKQLYDFMIAPNDASYSQWWPGTHRQFHITKRGADSPVGDEVYFDEYIGARSLRFIGVVTVANPARRITWQMKKGPIRLPSWLDLDMADEDHGVRIHHTLRVGFSGVMGILTDPIIKLYVHTRFLSDLEAHCREEWPRLAQLLNR